MKKVVLLTGHYWGSKRKAGFHWLGNAFQRLGWQVTFMTTSFSWPSLLTNDYRLQYPLRQEANRLLKTADGVYSFVWYTPFHPCNLKLGLLNVVCTPLFKRYGSLRLGEVETPLREADLVVFESGAPLLLFERIKALNPKAGCVYRVSDNMRVWNAHQTILDAEARLAQHFDLVSTPSRPILELFNGAPSAKLHWHGIQKDAFDAPVPNPYTERAAKNVVLVGQGKLFDGDFVARAAELFPDWLFHMVGPLPDLRAAPNVRLYGEQPFDRTVGYIKHADIGLMPIKPVAGADTFSDSLKIIQYTYCRLPIVAPDFLRSNRPHVLIYRMGDSASIRAALQAAADYNRRQISTEGIMSWIELAQTLADADTVPAMSSTTSGRADA